VALDKQQINALYRLRARHYDFSLGLYALAGFRLEWYRSLATKSLDLKAGDTVVDLACGTGLNFPYLKRTIGPSGRIIGVDLTVEMLDAAQRQITAHGWQNIELVQSDLAAYSFPASVGGVVSTYAITLVPEYDDVIRRAAAALRPGGRLAVLDFKRPEHWPEWLVRLGAWAYKPYGVSLDLAVRHPWESVDRYLRRVVYREFYHGGLYLCVGAAT
jgi:ubiquinone/menaquinone biosynthesis C-methylase UbiE